MSPDEHQLLAGLFDRVRGAANAPRDRDAEAYIAESIRAQPWAPYLLAQTVIVQEQNLADAGARIAELEARVRELETPAPASSGSFLGGGAGSIFGGSPGRQPAPPAANTSPWSRAGAQQQAPAYNAAPPQQPSPWQRQPQPSGWQQPQAAAPAASGGFLTSALGMAAGVAGGAMLANSLGGMFGGHKNEDHAFGGGQSASHGDDSLLDKPQQYAGGGSSSQDAIDDAQADANESFDTAGNSGDDSSEA